jgi:serine/threonine protein kinase
MVKNGFIIPTDKNVVDSKDINEIRFDGFEIIEQLKKSKNEQVCLAINKKNKMQVVLKFATFQENISEDRLIRRKEKFKQEFQILKDVGEHPNIYKLYDFISEKDLAVLEYIKGNTLKKVVQEEQLSLEPKLSLINQILEVLSFIHSKEIMHGDIHANQFMVQDGNIVKLIDFGFSNRTWNVQNEIIKRGGVHYYLEPENISDGAFNNVIEYRPSFHAEVYRIGVLLYFIIYEDYPFKSFSWKKLYDRIKNQDLTMNTTDPRGDSVSRGLRDIISKCLQKKPSARYKSSIEVFKDWKNIKIEC